MLINIFLVAAYLYDDKLTYILTVGGETITVTKSLMDAIDESNAGFLSSFFNGTAPPKCVDEKDAQQKRHTKVWCFCVIKRK